MTGDYFPRKDPNWGEINIWGSNPDVDALPWYEKYQYLKKRFSADGMLAVICKGKLIMGEDAAAAYALLNNSPLHDLDFHESEFGPVLHFGMRGWPTGRLMEKGIPIYQYFAGGWNHHNPVEFMDVCEFIDRLNGITRPEPVTRPPEPFEQLVQLRLF